MSATLKHGGTDSFVRTCAGVGPELAPADVTGAIMPERILDFIGRDEGQGLAEYALILALIAIVAIVALIFLGGQISDILSHVGSSM